MNVHCYKFTIMEDLNLCKIKNINWNNTLHSTYYWDVNDLACQLCSTPRVSSLQSYWERMWCLALVFIKWNPYEPISSMRLNAVKTRRYDLFVLKHMVKYRVQGLSHSTRCDLAQLGALRSFFAGPLPVGLRDTPQQKGGQGVSPSPW